MLLEIKSMLNLAVLSHHFFCMTQERAMFAGKTTAGGPQQNKGCNHTPTYPQSNQDPNDIPKSTFLHFPTFSIKKSTHKINLVSLAIQSLARFSTRVQLLKISSTASFA